MKQMGDDETMTQLTDAREIFKAAYENRYTWDDQFPGYAATVEFRQGDQAYTGKIKVSPDFQIEVTDVEGEEVRTILQRQTQEVITHRRRTAFEKAHGKNSFSLGKTDATGAVEILVQGDAMGSNYQVRDREISQVSRVMNKMAFTIDHKGSLKTEQGYISTHYDVVFRNAETQGLMSEMSVENTYEKVGAYYLLTHQVVRHQEPETPPVTDEFKFSQVRLLEPALA
ncbi:MAG: DUF3386 domain-containing protein [Leptolyngbyaceae cyanobacterium bins.59]|nr:DUF3386 domain-containing protein [Leptolyngbyaceae cyanobacterium bins.59]